MFTFEQCLAKGQQTEQVGLQETGPVGLTEPSVRQSGNRDDVSARTDDFKRTPERLAADCIVDAVIIMQDFVKRFGPVIDDFISAKLRNQIMSGGACRRCDVQAHRFRQLDRKGSDAAGTCLDQNLLSRCRLQDIV